MSASLEKQLTEKNIRNKFCIIGIFPFNPLAIDGKMGPSEFYRRRPSSGGKRSWPKVQRWTWHLQKIFGVSMENICRIAPSKKTSSLSQKCKRTILLTLRLSLENLRSGIQKGSLKDAILFQEQHLKMTMVEMRRQDLMKTMRVLMQLIDSLCCHSKIFQYMLHSLLLVNHKLTTARAISSNLISLQLLWKLRQPANRHYQKRLKRRGLQLRRKDVHRLEKLQKEKRCEEQVEERAANK